MTARANGVHHLAISTANIKAQIEFFSDVLGTELVALYWMHGGDRAFHGFLRLNDHSYVAFVQSPAVGPIPTEIGKTHPPNYIGSSAGGTMQHVALNVDTEEELIALRNRIRSRGIRVYGHMDHGFCKSIYFAGPENLLLEVAISDTVIDAESWIDPEVVALGGIDAAELARFKAPKHFVHTGPAIPQPPADPTKPHMTMDPAIKAFMSDPSDEELLEASLKLAAPPVTVTGLRPAH